MISVYSSRALRMVNSCQTKTVSLVASNDLGFTRKRDAKKISKDSITKTESRQGLTKIVRTFNEDEISVSTASASRFSIGSSQPPQI